MNNIKIDPDKVIKSNPIMIRESPIRYLEDIFENGEYLSHGIWVDAYKIELNNMDLFSQWLASEEYILGHSSGTWRKSINNHPILMSELYQLFLKSKEA